MKRAGMMLCMILMVFSLSGCGMIGEKTGSLCTVYGVTAAAAFLALIGYCCLIRKKDAWFLLLFSSVFVVNTGYLTLSLSRSLEEALLANRVAYLGSVLLPMSMLMIIVNVCRLNYKRWFPGLLLGVATVVFLIAASPGYLDIYYKETELRVVNGVAMLEKVYGPWHCVYLFYLLCYFVGTAAVIALGIMKGRIESRMHVVILAASAFVNMGVWLLEQLVRVELELLSVSYILCELFLLSLYLMMQENNASAARASEPAENPEPQERGLPSYAEPVQPDGSETDAEPDFEAKCAYLCRRLPDLTRTERMIYDYYLMGKTTKEVLAELNITENTLKYHNKNIYGKLGVSSRKQLREIAAALKQQDH